MTYIVIVNWNGWDDTIECLESVFRLQGAEFRVVVCDNGSTDDSLEHIRQWATGEQTAMPANESMSRFSSPAITKPVAYRSLSKAEAEQGHDASDAPLTLIDCEDNLGFAGGNNVGMRYALQQKDMNRVWLLNNDTVVDSAALSELLSKMDSTPGAGIAGSTLVFYHKPTHVQAFGGARYFPCLGLTVKIGRFRNRRRTVNEDAVERKLDFIVGASMLLTRQFMESVGLMSEDYFLYYEELDWALRAKGHFRQVYAQNSVVYHKVGASIGSSSAVKSRSDLADYHLMSNRIKITKRFFPRWWVSVYGVLCIEAVIRIFRGNSNQAVAIWRLLRGNPP